MTSQTSNDGARLLPVAAAPRVRRELRTLSRDRRGVLAAAVLAMATQSALTLTGPIAIGLVTQAIADRAGLDAIVFPVALLGVAAILGAVTTRVATVLLARAVLPMVARLREQTLSSAVHLRAGVVEAGGTGDLVSRVSGDVEQVNEAAEGAVGQFVGAALTIVATLVGLAGLDWRFALAGLLAVPIQAQTLRWYLRASAPIYAGGRTADGRRASALLAGFTALPTLRAFRLGGRQREHIAQASAESMDYEFRAIHAATRFYGRLNVAEFVGLAAILLVGYLLVRNDLSDVGAATTAALFFAGLFDPINTVLGVFDDIQRAAAGLARLIGVIDAAPTSDADDISADATRADDTAADDTALPSRGSGVEIDRVSFGYEDGPDVVRDISVRVAPGAQLAIVGATGSGKSTLAALLAGLHRPGRGNIRVDGEPVTRGSVALVTQESHLFSGSIADNLRLADPDADHERLNDALEAVEADWIAMLPDGLDTPIGSGGTALTPSRAQHLALARLLLLDPAVVVLDEATAEGGSDAARALDRGAAAVTRGRTSVVIAHRLSQTAAADTIAVMASGRIVEQGSHAELLAAGGSYASLWRAWAGDAG